MEEEKELDADLSFVRDSSKTAVQTARNMKMDEELKRKLRIKGGKNARVWLRFC